MNWPMNNAWSTDMYILAYDSENPELDVRIIISAADTEVLDVILKNMREVLGSSWVINLFPIDAKVL